MANSCVLAMRSGPQEDGSPPKSAAGSVFLNCSLHFYAWYGGFHKWGYPQSSSISRWDFPLHKPSSYWGTPMTMETPVCLDILVAQKLMVTVPLDIGREHTPYFQLSGTLQCLIQWGDTADKVRFWRKPKMIRLHSTCVPGGSERNTIFVGSKKCAKMADVLQLSYWTTGEWLSTGLLLWVHFEGLDLQFLTMFVVSLLATFNWCSSCGHQAIKKQFSEFLKITSDKTSSPNSSWFRQHPCFDSGNFGDEDQLRHLEVTPDVDPSTCSCFIYIYICVCIYIYVYIYNIYRIYIYSRNYHRLI